MSACPKCRTFHSEVRMTRRLRNGWVRRYRACLEADCGARYHTLEIPQDNIQSDVDREGMKEIEKCKT